MRIVIVGAGYVGLVTGACLADLGNRVTCLDVDNSKIEMLRSGSLPIFEPGLQELVDRNSAAGRLEFTDRYEQAVPNAELIMIAVGTPTSRTGKADLSAVVAATEAIAKVMESGTTVVIKSTVPVGTTAETAALISDIRPGLEFDIGSNPEFLRQGSAVEDFMQPERVVVGTRTTTAADFIRSIYEPILAKGAPEIVTDIETAELIKYASNSFLAVKLSYINEIADVCEEAGCNIVDLTRALGLDSRIGDKFLNPGPGYGGSCLPKDTQALLRTTHEVGAPSRVVAAAIDVNAARPARMASKIAAAVAGGDTIRGKRIAVFGLTFKANTDDLRESPAIEVIRSLIGMEAKVRAYDPQGMDQARQLSRRVKFADDPYACAQDADGVAILTEWAEFATLDLERLRSAMAHPVIVDLRNLYDPADMDRAGFTYHSIGR